MHVYVVSSGKSWSDASKPISLITTFQLIWPMQESVLNINEFPLFCNFSSKEFPKLIFLLRTSPL